MNQPPGGNNKPVQQGTQLMPNAAEYQQQIAAARAAQDQHQMQQQQPAAFAPTQFAGAAPAMPMGFGAPPQAQPQPAAAQPAFPGYGPPQGMQQPAPQMQMQQQAMQQQPMQQGYGQPGYAPQGQAAQGQLQQGQQGAPGVGGVAMPQFGIGGFRNGMPRIGFGGGDFSPGKLVAAVTTGQGFAHPRKMGLIMMGLAFAFTIVNTILIFVLHLYYPYLYSLGAIFWWGGLWLAITGQPGSRPDGTPAPGWSRAGLAVSLVMGLLMGIAMIFFNWERMLL